MVKRRGKYRLPGKDSIFFVGFLSLLMLGLIISGRVQFSVRGDISSLFPLSSPALRAHQETTDLFGSNEIETIIVDAGATLKEERRKRFDELESALSTIPGVANVVSPAIAYDDELFPFVLLTRNKFHGRFIVEIDGALSGKPRSDVDRQITKTLTSFGDLRPRRTGSFYLGFLVANTIQHEILLLTAISAAVIILVLALLFRSFDVAIKITLAPLFALLWAMFSLAFFNIPIGIVTQLAPPFLLMIGAGFSVGVALQLRGTSLEEAAEEYRQLKVSLLLAGLTTSLGLLSLLLVGVAEVAKFALLTSFGTALSAMFAITLTPALLKKDLARLGEKPNFLISPEMFRRVFVNLPVCLLLILGVLLLGAKARSLKTNADLLEFLPEGSEAREAYIEANDIFPGNKLLSVIIKRNDGAALTKQDFDFVKRLQVRFSRHVDVHHATSVFDLQRYYDAQAREGAVVEGDDAKSSYLSPEAFVTSDLRATRMILETHESGPSLLQVKRDIARIAASQTTISHSVLSIEEPALPEKPDYTGPPESTIPLDEKETVAATTTEGSSKKGEQIFDLNFDITSPEFLLIEQKNNVIRGVIRSLGMFLCIVTIILALTVRSLPVVVIGLVPNLLPIPIAFGALQQVFGSMNLGSCLVATASLAIVVDHTFGFLVRWKAATQRYGMKANDKIISALFDAHYSTFAKTTLVLILSALVLGLSRVAPVTHFGILLSLTLAVGLIADLIVLPVLLRYFGASGVRQKAKSQEADLVGKHAVNQ